MYGPDDDCDDEESVNESDWNRGYYSDDDDEEKEDDDPYDIDYGYGPIDYGSE